MKKHYSLHSNRFYHIGNRLISSPWFLFAIILLLVVSEIMCVYRYELVGDSVMQLQAKDVSDGGMIKGLMIQVAIGLLIASAITKKRKH